MTLSGTSAAARLNINRETFFSNLIFWSLYFRIFYFQEFVSSGVCLVRSLSRQEFVFQEFVFSGVCLSGVCHFGVCHSGVCHGAL